ncbi:MAG: hypothetical protein B7C24_13895 [Bacteroidetes bacterium 4572_77]|nr:MAG: hypothetical protein B7C24_13895 [Bacteroidetes bacterium 4572_77]
MNKGYFKRQKNWFVLEEASSFNVDELEKIQVHISETETKSFAELNHDEKTQARQMLEFEANSVLRMLNGEVKSNEKISSFIKNSLNEGTFGTVFSTAVEVFILDYIRPQLIVSNALATTIPVGSKINKSLIALIRSFGSVKIGEVPKTGTLPILNPNLAEYAEQIGFDIKKYGVKIELENDMLESDEWGIFGYLLTQIADAFKQRKEYEVLKIVNQSGEVILDNGAGMPNSSLGMGTTGMDVSGGANGTVTLDDFVKVFGYMSIRGHIPTTILVNPFLLYNMYGDSELKSIIGLSQEYGIPAGNAMEPGWNNPIGEDWGVRMRTFGPDNATPMAPGGVPVTVPGFGMAGEPGLGIDPYAQTLSGLNMQKTFRANIPGQNITIVSSPLVPYRVVDLPYIGAGTPTRPKFVTNIYVIGQTKPVGILQEQAPAPLKWTDVEKEINFMGFREKYAAVPMFQGRGVYTMKNIVVDRNYARPTVVSQAGILSEPGYNAVV